MHCQKKFLTHFTSKKSVFYKNYFRIYFGVTWHVKIKRKESLNVFKNNFLIFNKTTYAFLMHFSGMN